MFRWVGFFIMIAGSCGCGFSIIKERRDYLERCRSFEELLEMMENEIAFQKSSLPEICGRISPRLSGKRRDFLEKTGKAFLENKGDTLGEIWEREMKEAFKEEGLKKEIQEELEKLGAKLCFEDGKMQRKVLRDTQDLIKKHREEQEKLNKERNKLTLCAGVMGGLLLTILLL